MFRSLATYALRLLTQDALPMVILCYTLVLLVDVVSRGFVRMCVRNNSSISGAIRTPGMLKIDASEITKKSTGDIPYSTKTKHLVKV